MYDYCDYEDYRAEARAEARREAAADEFDRVAVTCTGCGGRWNPGVHRATRTDPAYVDRDECPNGCQSEVWEWLSRDEQRAVTDRLVDEYEQAEIAGDEREKARIDALLEKLT